MVNMNEDFGAYKDSIWKGLTARELGVMAVSAVSCGIIIILLYFILGWNLYISFLIGTAVAAAIIFSQVWKSRSGLSAIEFYRARKYRKSTAKLVWKSDEYNQARKNYLKTINEQISNFAQTYPTNLEASSNEALLFMRRYRFANCSCFSCCFKDAYPSSNVQ